MVHVSVLKPNKFITKIVTIPVSERNLAHSFTKVHEGKLIVTIP